jgi:hypothetical protein
MGGEISGHYFAAWGVGLAGIFFVIGLGTYYVPRWTAMADVRQTVDRWVNHLREGDALSAFMLTLPAFERPADLNALQKLLEADRKSRRQFEKFQQLPLVATLLALGDRAHPAYYDMEQFGTIEGRLGAVTVYEVQYVDEDQQPQKFLARIDLVYSYDAYGKRPMWYVVEQQVPYAPHSYRPRESAAHEHDS